MCVGVFVLDGGGLDEILNVICCVMFCEVLNLRIIFLLCV